MSKIKEELIAHTVIFVLMAVLFWESRTFPDLNIGGTLGAAWWPQLVLGLGMLLTLASAAMAVRKSVLEPGKKARVTLAELKSLGMSCGIFVVFLLAIEVVGFLGAVPLLVIGIIYQLGARTLPILIFVPILSSPLFAIVFGRFMEVPLPRGMGLVRILSFYVY
jgi:putative tricarboxylic transport membrane protein